MQGVAVFDDRARHIWVSCEHPELTGQVVGTPIWEFVHPGHLAMLHEVLCRAMFDGEAVQYTVVAGPSGDMREFDCELRPLKTCAFVVIFRGRNAVRLTPREREILLALCNDEKQDATGRRLGISPKTVESFRVKLREKASSRGNSGVVRWAIRNGIIDA